MLYTQTRATLAHVFLCWSPVKFEKKWSNTIFAFIYTNHALSHYNSQFPFSVECLKKKLKITSTLKFIFRYTSQKHSIAGSLLRHGVSISFKRSMWGGKQIIKTKTNSQQQKSDYSQPLRHVIELTLPLMSHQCFAKEKYKMFASLKGNIKIYKSKLVSESKRSDSKKKKIKYYNFFEYAYENKTLARCGWGKWKSTKMLFTGGTILRMVFSMEKWGTKKKQTKKSKIWFTL